MPAAFVGWYLSSRSEARPIKTLPFYGPKGSADPSKHTVPDFTFTNQYNKPVTAQTLSGKVYVTDFFFTTCRTICPVMTDYLSEIHELFSGEPDFRILSHTVDPETDNVSVLNGYAQRRGVSDERWLFVTGDKRHIYELARTGYLLAPPGDSGDPDDFVHTQNFALVDKNRRIRGLYDGTDSLEMVRLKQDIRELLAEK